jgi:tetratricopeptide (TPR) repeat protein
MALGNRVLGVVSRLLALWLALGVTSAQAQEASAAPAAVDNGDAFARKVFAAGKAAYEIGNYQDALRYFQQAYELSGRATLLYNVGQAADRMRYDETALAALKRYLAELPDAANRVEVQERIRVLEGVVAAKQAQQAQLDAAQSASVVAPPPAAVAAAAMQPTPKPAPAPASSDGQKDEPIYTQWWLWTGAGVAVAAVVVVALFAGGGSEADERTPYKGSNGTVTATLRAEMP